MEHENKNFSSTDSTDDPKRNFTKRKSNNKRKGSGRRSNPKYDGSEERVTESSRFGSVKFTNDPSWYVGDGSLARNAISLPFNNPLGGKDEYLLHAVIGDIPDIVSTSKLPGIMTIALQHTLGPIDGSADSEINMLSQYLYAYLRGTIKGRTQSYTGIDVAQVIVAVGELFSFISYCQRAYGVLNTFSGTNRYIAQGLVEAMGLDYDDLIANLANFRYWINNFVTRASALKVPSDIPYFHRKKSLYSNVYTDEDIAKPELYLFVPYSFGKYKETGYTGNFNGESFATVAVEFTRYWQLDGSNLHTFANIRSIGENLLQPLLNSAAVITIISDILAAYGEQNTMSMELVSDTYTLLPITDPYIAMQIENMTLNYLEPNLSYWDIIQVPDYNILAYNHSAPGQKQGIVDANGDYSTWAIFSNKWFLNFHIPSPDNNAIFEATRLMYLCESQSLEITDGDEISIDYSADLSTFGIELPVQCVTYTLAENGNNLRFISYDCTSNCIYTDKPDDTFVNSMGKLTNFKNHPLVYTCKADKFAGQWRTHRYVPIGDISNYNIVGVDALRDINNVALLNIFRVPQTMLDIKSVNISK